MSELCNRCGAALLPAGDGVVPIVRCSTPGCRREIPASAFDPESRYLHALAAWQAETTRHPALLGSNNRPSPDFPGARE